MDITLGHLAAGKERTRQCRVPTASEKNFANFA